ncbi:MAG: Sporulation integral membrane protein YlbJ [Firmicutes bacterium ADurb.Bin300]|nr:MAG: Sporulation integral membrane protein YlbJ [Firmicutes bacterium ADurb.Bin300]
MKNTTESILKDVPKIIIIIIAALGLLFYSQEAASGIRDGIALTLQTLLPSLFPFLVLSAYIVNSGALKPLAKGCSFILRFLFNLNENALPAILMGLIGGYPVGAMTTASLFRKNEINQNEAERLMLFAVNGGPAFIITAVGTGMLKNKTLGIVLFFSVALSSLIIGIVLRFLSEGEKSKNTVDFNLFKKNAFTSAVSEASKSIIGVAGWVLTFSCIAGLMDALGITAYYSAVLKGILEISTGSRACAGVLPLPVLAALLSFGGIAVICQIKPYADECGVKIKKLLTFRLLCAAISAFICSQILNIFNISSDTSTIIPDKIAFSAFSTPASVLLILMCAVFILDVENKREKW